MTEPEDLRFQNATAFKKSTPGSLDVFNISSELTCVFYCACHAKCIFAVFFKCPTPAKPLKRRKTFTFLLILDKVRILCACQAKRRLNVQKCSNTVSFLHFWLRNLLRGTRAYTFGTSQLPTMVRARCVLYILPPKRASCHSSVHFWNVFLIKNGSKLRCFYTFDFHMGIAPQRRALFPHRNFQKCSERGVFCTFSLRNVLRTTTTCNFSSFIWPDGSSPATLASLLFDLLEPQIVENSQGFATFLCFRAPAFLLDFFSSLIFLLPFSSLTLPTSAFSFVHIVVEVWLPNFLHWIKRINQLLRIVQLAGA